MELSNNNNDHRPFTKDLLEQHSSDLSEMRAILEKEDNYSKEHYDDIWMLRFLLTHKKVKKASSVAIKTMNFRKEYKLNELGDVRNKLVDHMDHKSDRYFDIMKKALTFAKDSTAIMYAQPDQDRCLIQIICPDQLDMASQVVGMTHDEVLNLYIYANEMIYQVLDEVTRRTGRLTKLLRIIDASSFSMSTFNREWAKRDAAANKQLEDFYPQMLGKVIISNIGSWFTVIWRLLKPVCPKRMVEKLAFVQPHKYSSDAAFFLPFVSKDNLWKRYGGNSSDWPVTQPSHLWMEQ